MRESHHDTNELSTIVAYLYIFATLQRLGFMFNPRGQAPVLKKCVFILIVGVRCGKLEYTLSDLFFMFARLFYLGFWTGQDMFALRKRMEKAFTARFVVHAYSRERNMGVL